MPITQHGFHKQSFQQLFTVHARHSSSGHWPKEQHNCNSLNTIGTSLVAQTDNQLLSPFAQIMSALQQLQQSDPAQYQQVTQQIATNLQTAAQSAQASGNSTAANQLKQLSADFTSASKSDQLPNVQDLAQAIVGGHHHHHHAHAASADPDGDSSANGSSISSSSSTSQTLSQFLSAFQAFLSFGTRRSVVRIHSPRPILSIAYSLFTA